MFMRDYEMSLLVAFKDGMEACNILKARDQEKELRCFASKRGIAPESVDELIKEVMEEDYTFNRANSSTDRIPKPEDLAEGEFWLKPIKKKEAAVPGRTIIMNGKPIFVKEEEITETV